MKSYNSRRNRGTFFGGLLGVAGLGLGILGTVIDRESVSYIGLVSSTIGAFSFLTNYCEDSKKLKQTDMKIRDTEDKIKLLEGHCF